MKTKLTLRSFILIIVSISYFIGGGFLFYKGCNNSWSCSMDIAKSWLETYLILHNIICCTLIPITIISIGEDLI